MENTIINYVWEFLKQHNIATEKELILVCRINGYKVETLNDVLYARTGYHDIEQYEDMELDTKYANWA